MREGAPLESGMRNGFKRGPLRDTHTPRVAPTLQVAAVFGLKPCTAVASLSLWPSHSIRTQKSQDSSETPPEVKISARKAESTSKTSRSEFDMTAPFINFE